MDKQTRNLIQKATQDARNLLENEFGEQLEGIFDILPNGEIASEPGKHLNPGQCIIREKVVAAIEHEKAGGVSYADAVANYLREVSFTCLNRFAALKMLEARGLLQECVSRGDQSAGFKEFCGLAPGLAELPDKGYRLYIESLFDELSTEIRVLFDRRDMASLLWPRRKAFEGLLDILNREEIAGIWGEDETIGWVYQYFNSGEERKKMREESAAPRNSRELAVRNQFFTPRYVVEFLTDNTLGRIWYEMRQGNTVLKDECQYLVRRPDEVFLGALTHSDENGDNPEGVKIADLLQTGTEETFPPFTERDEDIQKIVLLAHTVDGYSRHPHDDMVENEWWPWWKKRKIIEQGSFTDVSSQDMLDILFAEARAERHGGGDGVAFLQEPILMDMANEIRNRAVACRKENLSKEELLQQTVFVPFRRKKDPRDIKILDPACGSGHFLLYAFDLLENIYEEAWVDEESPRSEITGKNIRADYPTREDLKHHIPKLVIEHNLHGIDIDHRAVQIAALSLWMRAQRSWKMQETKADKRPRITKSNIVTAEPMPGEENMRKEFIAGLKPRVLGQLVEVVFKKMELAGEAGVLLKIEEEIKDAVAEAKRQWIEVPVPEQQSMFFEVGAPKPEQLKLKFDVKSVTEENFWEQTEELILDALREYAEQVGNGQALRRRLFIEDAARGFAFVDLCRMKYDLALMNPPFGDPSRVCRALLESSYKYLSNDISVCFVQRTTDILSPNGRIGILSPRNPLYLETFIKYRRDYFLEKLVLQNFADLGFGVLDNAMIEVSAATFMKLERPQYQHSKTTVFHLLNSTSRREKLLSMVKKNSSNSLFVIDIKRISQIEGMPFCYWLTPRLLNTLANTRLLKEVADTKWGAFTADDPRFLRTWWETQVGDYWCPYYKGGAFGRFVYVSDLVIDWRLEGAQIKENRDSNGRSRSRLPNTDFYFKKGLSFPNVTFKGLAIRALPEGSIFSLKGPGIFPKDPEMLLVLLALLNSRIGEFFVSAQSPTRRWDLAQVARIPIPNVPQCIREKLESLAHDCIEAEIPPWKLEETSKYFCLPFFQMKEPVSLKRMVGTLNGELEKINEIGQSSLNNIELLVKDLFELDEDDIKCISRFTAGSSLQINEKSIDYSEQKESNNRYILEQAFSKNIFFYSVGLVFARWDVRIAISPFLTPKVSDPFEKLPNCPPGILVSPDGLSAQPNRIVSEEWLRARPDANTPPPEGSFQNPTIPDSQYPIRISWDGILVDDPGFNGGQLHQEDIIRRTREVLNVLWKEKAQDIEQEACDILKIPDLRAYFRKSFFPDHIKRYSKSRRKAPIYWQLSTPSASYSVWLYYHRFTKDTFYKVLNEYVTPKLQFEERDLTGARQQYGSSPTANQRKEIEGRETFVAELKTFKEEVARVAPLWNPNLNDGVIINFALLWRLVPQNRSWQKECKKIWDKLVKGDYDWAHLAMHLWPERVVPKCTTDRSLAIAHELDEILWEEDEKGKWHPKDISKETLESLIRDRTSITVKAALEDLLNAPVPTGPTRKRRKRKT